MKLSVKVEYACRVLAQLASNAERNELAHIEVLAESEQIPANYLAQILTELRNAGLIISRRGKQGGYALAKRPDEITLYDIVKSIDGELLDLPRTNAGESGARVRAVWLDIRDVLETKTRKITLDQFSRPEGEKMYYI